MITSLFYLHAETKERMMLSGNAAASTASLCIRREPFLLCVCKGLGSECRDSSQDCCRLRFCSCHVCIKVRSGAESGSFSFLAASQRQRRFVSVLTKKRSEGHALLFNVQILRIIWVSFCNFVLLKEGNNLLSPAGKWYLCDDTSTKTHQINSGDVFCR
jgi:hypothetical protein